MWGTMSASKTPLMDVKSKRDLWVCFKIEQCYQSLLKRWHNVAGKCRLADVFNSCLSPTTASWVDSPQWVCFLIRNTDLQEH